MERFLLLGVGVREGVYLYRAPLYKEAQAAAAEVTVQAEVPEVVLLSPVEARRGRVEAAVQRELARVGAQI